MIATDSNEASGEYYPLSREQARAKFTKPVHLCWLWNGVAIVTENGGEDDRRIRINCKELFGSDRTEWYMGMSPDAQASDLLNRARLEKDVNEWLGLIEPETAATPAT